MVKIKIDNRELETPDGTLVLKAARDAGYNIPSLCHDDNLPHYTSCMMCMVRDNRTKNYFASCSVQVQDGMDLDVSSDDVIALRKKSLELLFSEHRAECEAPCRMVCPAGYNIPLFNRHLSSKNFDAATELTVNEVGETTLACFNCQGYCENACRRKKIDIPVSIRNMKIFIYSEKHPEAVNAELQQDSEKGRIKNIQVKRFNSLIGKLEPEEQAGWLKEADPEVVRYRSIENILQAASESASCMHCDCRAANDCKFRDLADSFMIKNPRGKLVNAPIEKKINKRTGLIFENAKCIKCGLCVRLCEKNNYEPALCFINRGFISIISEPLTEEFDDILTSGSREVAEICPTGALSIFK
jgi:hypothetical protein